MDLDDWRSRINNLDAEILLLLNQRVYWNIRWGLYNSSAAPAEALGCIERPQRMARKAAFHFEGDRMTPPGKTE